MVEFKDFKTSLGRFVVPKQFSHKSEEEVVEFFDTVEGPWESLKDDEPEQDIGSHISELSELFGKKDLPLQTQNGIFEFIGSCGTAIDSVSEISSFIHHIKTALSFSGTPDTALTENAASRLEDLILFILQISTASSFKTVMISCVQYFKTFAPESIVLRVMESFRARNFAKPHLQGGKGGEKEEKEPTPQDIIADWRAYRDHPLAKAIGDLITVASIMGLAPNYGENVLCSELYDLLGAKVNKSYTSATRFLDVVTSVVNFIVKFVIPCIEHKDLGLLLLPDDELMSMEEKYAAVMGCRQYIDIGRLDLITPDRCPFSNECDLDVQTDELISEMATLCKKTKNEYVRNVCCQKLVNLKKIQASLHIERSNNPLKEQPFMVKIFGASSVGKSKLHLCLMAHLANAINIPFNTNTVCHLNASETKYDSQTKPKHKIIMADEVCSKLPAQEENSPLDVFMKIANMVPHAINKADVDSKGKMDYMALLAGLTTNVWNLFVFDYQAEPGALMRRMQLHLNVKLRPECQAEDGSPKEGALDGMYPDAYLIDIFTVKLIRSKRKLDNSHQPDKFEYVLHKANASIFELLEFAATRCKDWMALQKNAVGEANAYYGATFCEHGFIEEHCMACNTGKSLESLNSLRCDSNCKIPEGCTNFDCSLKCLHDLDCTPLIKHGGFEGSDAIARVEEADLYLPTPSLLETCKSALDKYSDALTISAIAAAVLSILKMYSTFRTIHNDEETETQGTSHSSAEKVPFPKGIERPNPWKKAVVAPLPKSVAGDTTSLDDMVLKMRKEIGIFEYVPLGGDYRKPDWSMCIPYAENVWIVPYHVVSAHPEMNVAIRFGGTNDVGLRRGTDCIDSNDWVRIGNRDLALVRVAGAGSVQDMRKFFAQKPTFKQGRVASVIKNFAGDVSTHFFTVSGIEVFTNFVGDDSGKLAGPRLVYKDFTTFMPYKGLCMMPVITFSAKPAVVGFHVAGNAEKSLGVAELASLFEMETAFQNLNSKNMLRTASAGTFPTELMGVPLELNSVIPTTHCANFMPTHDGEIPVVHGFEIYGQHGLGRATFRSSVRESPISYHVWDVMGKARMHGSPAGGAPYRDYQRELDVITSGASHFEPCIMRAAFKAELSFWDRMLENFEHDDIAPLPYKYAVNGMDGIRGLDKIDRSTSMGLPIKKPKKNFMEPMQEEVPGVTEPWDFTDESGVYEEIDRMLEHYRANERAYMLFAATEKDEPTKFGKDKRRIFAGCPVAAVILVRRYFLPILRFIQREWRHTGSAVGINAHSNEWHELFQIITKFSEERIIPGDYSAFDKRAKPPFTLRSMYIFYSIGEKCGYTSDDLLVMRGLMTDMVYPVYDWHGVFIQMLGSVPSGIPITVHLNNIINRMYLRYAIYSEYSQHGIPKLELFEKAPMLEDVASLALFGDDNIMSISEDEPYITHTALQDRLAEIGVKYTMSDKTSESVKFLTIWDSDFLKRGFHKHENGFITAPLDENSIMKSLHCYIKKKHSPVKPEEIALQAVYSAVLEYYQYGFDVFHLKRDQLTQVLSNATMKVAGEDLPLIRLLPNSTLPDWAECSERYITSFGTSEI